MDTDRLEKTVVVPAARSRVWHALTTSAEFGKWFGIEFNEEFTPNARLEGKVTTPGYEHVRAEITIERMEPEWLFSWRWHPSATDAAGDYSREPTTLVTFEFSDVVGGTMLTITESGFDKIPAERRQKAYKSNEAGWTRQMQAITRHLARAA